MYSCESSWRPLTKCFAMRPIELVRRPMPNDAAGAASRLLRTWRWYSHVAQNPPVAEAPVAQDSASCGPAAKCAVRSLV